VVPAGAVGPMNHLPQAMLLFAGGCGGALLAGVCALLLDANLSDGLQVVTILPSLINCAAVGILITRCIAR
jgi:hypothetical protein